MAKAKEYKKNINYMKKLKPKDLTPEAKKFLKELKPLKGKTAKKVIAKKTVSKALLRNVTGLGAVVIAHDVIKGVSKLTCGKRGGKWVSGKCVGSKKVKPPTNQTKVKDPISKR